MKPASLDTLWQSGLLKTGSQCLPPSASLAPTFCAKVSHTNAHFNDMDAMTALETGHGALGSFFVAQWIYQVQKQGLYVAYLHVDPLDFYPQDLDSVGVDLHALICVQCDQIKDVFKAAEILIKSQSFGLILMAYPETSVLPQSFASRLRIAMRHTTCKVIHLYPDTPENLSTETVLSGKMTTQRLKATVTYQGFNQFSTHLHSVKGSAFKVSQEVVYGFDGLR